MGEQVPLISVLLPVYNGAAYLKESIDSILSQTLPDFELIIINDGSRDESAEMIRNYSDSRIRYFEQENIGLAATLNRGMELAKGVFIARQDQDDISKQSRFTKQADFLNAHPDCALVGTWADILTEKQASGRILEHPADDPMIKLALLFSNPFVHSSVMMRKECLRKMGGYSVDPARQPPADYELWSRFARHFDMANIPEPLVTYREVGCSMSRSTNSQFWERVVNICQENIQATLGYTYDQECIRSAARLYHGIDDPSGNLNAGKLVVLIRDLADVLEVQYPEYRQQVRARLTHVFNTMLHCHYSRYCGKTLARYPVLFRSLWLFR